MTDTIYVALDIETTGFQPGRDSIIEIAAIEFQGNKVLSEFSTLVNPHQDIPDFITDLTGISDKMVTDAPDIFTLRDELQALLTDKIVVGHNIGFDMSFLAQEFIGVNVPRLDTLTLTTILYPQMGRYTLEAVTAELGIRPWDEAQTHRALADTRLTMSLFLALQEKGQTVETHLLEEIVAQGKLIDWPENHFFENALAYRTRHAFTSKKGSASSKLFQPTAPEGTLAAPQEETEPIETDFIAGMLSPQGNFAHSFPDFEQRPQQVEMVRAVAEALNKRQNLLVEAGTGTGKSVGYLLPAAFWAQTNNRRVVVSTNTINLQDQLLHKDIPALQEIVPFPLHAAIRKGRRNYLCTRLFRQMRHNGVRSADELVLLARILLWLPTTDNGDIAEISLRTTGEQMAWARMNGDNVVCRSDDCAQENCPLHVAKRRAELAHIVVVNHALLLSDVANEGHILPDFTDLIVDEAHHLETAVTDGLSFRVDQRFLDAVLDEIMQPRSGIVAQLQGQIKGVPAQFTTLINDYVDKLRQSAGRAQDRIEDLFAALTIFMKQEVRGGSNNFAQQVRLLPKARETGAFADVESSWENVNNLLKELAKGYEKLAATVADLSHVTDLPEGEALQAGLQSYGRDLEKTRAQMNDLITTYDAEMIQWFELYRDNVSLHSAPLHIGPLVEAHIFEGKESVILTSATIRTHGQGSRSQEPSFAYIRDRLHAHAADELAVGSPFDYKNNTLLYLCSDIPEPNQPGYDRYLEDAIVDVATALGGRTMVLFTSYKQLDNTRQAIEGRLRQENIQLLAQGRSMSRQQLQLQFKRPETRAVLLGTRSFWEGVDIPGDALQAVLLTKIPFDVPSDPIFAARSETFENSFMEYSVPEAILRFRQGFGRLIRRRDDEGVVAILDKRVLSKRYGNLFLQALPECTMLRQRTSRLGELTVRWLNREKK
ncbi:MAG TPA: helicase C-terminal domain-containing protein [Anaerolineae bacterium]|nr:helicase C-terminal domain-containing protein [Anaerolineae bacterium]